MSETFKYKSDAEAWVVKEEAKMGVSKLDPLQLKHAKAMTVRDIFERNLAEVTVNNRGRNAKNTLKRIIRDAAFMRILAAKIKPTDIRDWRDARVKEVKPQSVNREMATISGVFTHAIKEWDVPMHSNPCHLVSLYTGADKPRNKRWSPADTQTLLDAIGWKEDMVLSKGRDYVGWGLLLGIETAMRVGEMCEMRVANFHPQELYVHLDATKNGDERDVPLSKRAVVLMTAMCKDKKPADKIIPICANTFSEYILDARTKAGLLHLVMHDSRHEGATRLSKKLSNVLELSAVTGHRSLRALKRYYHPDPTEMAGKLD